MADVELLVLSCPNCAAPLRAVNIKDPVPCAYCGCTVIPVEKSSRGGATNVSADMVRIDGIQNSTSALAYLENFFDTYDWETFAYSNDISIRQIDLLVSQQMVTSADQKNTWILAFLSVYTPYVKKISACGDMMNDIVTSYKNSNLDAYSKFDSYNGVVRVLIAEKNDVIAKGEKYITNAEKYGASGTELYDMNSKLDALRNFDGFTTFESVESIPQIKTYILENNEAIKRELLEDGIDADSEYQKALTYIKAKKYDAALDTLLRLKGYRDSEKLIKEANRFFVVDGGALEIAGSLYYLSKNLDGTIYDLYEVRDCKTYGKPILKNIKSIITNYAQIIYYVDTSDFLRRFDLTSHRSDKVYKNKFDYENIFSASEGQVYIPTRNDAGNSTVPTAELVMLDLSSGNTKVVLKNICKVYAVDGKKIVYEERNKHGNIETKLCDLDGCNALTVGADVKVEYIDKDYVVYSKHSPNEYNKDIFVMPWSGEPRLIEKNIFKFEGVYSGKLFYFVGGRSRHSLISINLDGTQRREFPSYASTIICNLGDYIYFIRRVGHNATLCKSHTDGSDMCVISSDLEKFITLKYGYMYYIDYHHSLVRIRMDGTDRRDLCEKVGKDVYVYDNKIIFTAVDGRWKQDGSEEWHLVKSIYQVDPFGEGMRKLVYDVKSMCYTSSSFEKEIREIESDDESISRSDSTVYYVAEGADSDNNRCDVLYKINLQSGEITKLLVLQVAKWKKWWGVILSVIFALLLGVMLIVGIRTENLMLAILSGLGLFAMAVIAVGRLLIKIE